MNAHTRKPLQTSCVRLVAGGMRTVLLSAAMLAIAPALIAQIGTPSASEIAPSYGPVANSSTGAALAAKSGMTAGTLTAVPEDFSKLEIAPGFLLDAEVYDEPDLSSQLRVGPNGDVIMPLAGAIHVAGDTLAEAQDRIQQKLISAEIMKSPQVTLNVVQYAPTIVTVLGEVNNPGRLQMLAPHSLLDVISFAGGETALAGGTLEVRQPDHGQTVTTAYHYGRNSNGDSISKVTVQDGDTVIVPRAGIVYVLGAVTRPGGYLMQEDGKFDAAQALSVALGTTMAAKTGSIRIIRRRPDGTFVEIPLDYQKMVKGKITPPPLQAQDIVYVPVSKFKAALTSGTNVLSAATSATIYTAR